MVRGKGKSLGREIIDDLKDLCDTVDSGERIEKRFTVRTVALDLKPREFSEDDVRRLRESLGVSQAIFAEILAVSPDTVASWEQGTRTPKPIACRLLELIGRNRQTWVDLLRESAKETTAA